jgi:undecaprenyl-diphosphatase
LIGFARVWAGVHYPGDIAAAAVIATLSAFVVYVIDRGSRELVSRRGPVDRPRRVLEPGPRR